MKPIALTLAALLAATSLAPAPALAKGPDHCPPGLAKKDPPCVPPGQAKKYQIGDRWGGDGERVREWWRYDLERPARDENWVRIGDAIVKVNDETKLVIDIIRLADVVLSN